MSSHYGRCRSTSWRNVAEVRSGVSPYTTSRIPLLRFSQELAQAYDITYPTVRLRLDRVIEKIRIFDNQKIASDFEKTLTFYISYIAPRPLLRDNDSTNNREV